MTKLIFLLWFLGAIAVGIWNHKRGYTFLMGFVVSLLFSPIVGAIVVMLYRDQSKNPSVVGTNPKSLKKCPHCAEDIKKDAKICKHCGRDL